MKFRRYEQELPGLISWFIVIKTDFVGLTIVDMSTFRTFTTHHHYKSMTVYSAYRDGQVVYGY